MPERMNDYQQGSVFSRDYLSDNFCQDHYCTHWFLVLAKVWWCWP